MDHGRARPFVKNGGAEPSLTSIKKKLTADPNGYAGADFAADIRAMLGEEAKEGLAAFAEKRKPGWSA